MEAMGTKVTEAIQGSNVRSVEATQGLLEIPAAMSVNAGCHERRATISRSSNLIYLNPMGLMNYNCQILYIIVIAFSLFVFDCLLFCSVAATCFVRNGRFND